MTKKILVVDDEPLNRTETASKFKQAGYQVEQAVNGIDALKKFITDHFDVILIDDDLPAMDGCQVTKKIREYEVGTTKRSVIIGVTNNGGEDVEAKCLRAGMDACFDKANDAPSLQQTVRRWALIA